MDWISNLQTSHAVAHAILIISLVIVAGLGLGSIRLRGIGLGSAGVLFAGILAGHFGQTADHDILDFAKEFGLILFVFTIGLQLGPSFLATLRHQGLKLNLLAAAIVFGGAGMAILTGWLWRFDFAGVLGLFSGATTNTPALGAGQQTLAALPGVTADRAALPALAYAVSYPVGIAGIIGSLLVVKWWFKIDPAREAEEFQSTHQRQTEPLLRRTLLVENVNLNGVAIGDIPGRTETGVTLSRIRPAGAEKAMVARAETKLTVGDAILVVGTAAGLDRFQVIVGRATDQDLSTAPAQVSFRRIIVTHKSMFGKTIRELQTRRRHNVTITRISRTNIEMTPFPEMRLQFGDVLSVVGEDADLDQVAAEAGNSAKALDHTQFIPMFLGIALGILVGLIPFHFPGIPEPVRLGLAGGPLLLAIVLSRAGNIGPLVWYMPPNTNLAFRELGITLFLACVGIKAGEQFFATVFTTIGLQWLLAAALITVIPLLAVGWLGRKVLRLNYMTLSGLMSGSMTDPPALAFAGNISKSDAPAIAYATVYPLTMLLRILCAQLLVLWFC